MAVRVAAASLRRALSAFSCRRGDAVTIGRIQTVPDRRWTLQCANASPLNVLAHFPDNGGSETAPHHRLAAIAIRRIVRGRREAVPERQRAAEHTLDEIRGAVTVSKVPAIKESSHDHARLMPCVRMEGGLGRGRRAVAAAPSSSLADVASHEAPRNIAAAQHYYTNLTTGKFTTLRCRRDTTRLNAGESMMERPEQDTHGLKAGSASSASQLLAPMHADRERDGEIATDHYRLSVELAHHISWSADPSGAIRTVSSRWEKITGIDRARALDSGWVDALHPADIQQTLGAWEHAIATSSPIEIDYRLRSHDGHYRWFRSRASPHLNESGLVLAWFGTLEDIHDRKRAEEALQVSEERFRLAAQAAGIGIWDYDAVLRHLTWSDEFRSMLGLGHGVAADPANALALVIEEDRPLLQRLIDALPDGSAAARFDVTLRISRADTGAIRWIQTSGWRVKAANDRIERVLVTVRDVTERVKAEQRIRWAAEHDPLTGLANRTAFSLMLEEAIARQDGDCRTVLALALFDVDHLKDINDTIGHDAGDRLLCTVADRLGTALGQEALVARLGGDEFAAIVEADTIEAAQERFAAALKLLRQPVEAELMTMDCQATAGAVVFPRDGRNAPDLLKSADIALYAGKAGARGTVSMFRPEMRAGMQRRASMLSLARMITRDDRVMPYYQPKVRLTDGSLSGFEALLRWRHDTLGIQGPDTITAAFDDLAIAGALGERMLERVCLDLARWRTDGATLVPVAVNLSSAEFRRGDLFDRVMAQLRAHDLPANLIELEVTETVFLGRGGEMVGDTLAAFHRAGISIALDDFGTGYASLKHLRDFPVDTIKIDRGFVADLLDDPGGAAIVDAVLSLAQRLGVTVVAEGVETEAQAAYLMARDCPLAQGYLFGRPMPADQAAELLHARQPAIRP